MDAVATVTRRSDYSLESQLYNEAFEFNFSQAIRILQAVNPSEHPLGEGDNPLKEALQIQSRITFSVSSSDIYQVTPSSRPILTVNFLGLAGIQGPLPTPYTEKIIERLRQKDTAGRDFLDIFNHRLVSFWYRIHKKFVLGLDILPPQQTAVGKTLLDLLGLNHAGLQEALGIPERSLLSFTPLFWQRNRSTAGLQQVLKTYFKIHIRIEELQGKWRTALPQDISLIGVQKGQYNQVGKGLILGKKSWDQAASIHIYLEHLSWSNYLSHLPGQPAYTALRALTQFYTGLHLTCHFYAQLVKEDIPPCLLGQKSRLGQTSWITRGKGQGFKASPKVRLS